MKKSPQNNCIESGIREKVTLLASGQKMTAADKKQIEEHMIECTECRTLYANIRLDIEESMPELTPWPKPEKKTVAEIVINVAKNLFFPEPNSALVPASVAVLNSGQGSPALEYTLPDRLPGARLRVYNSGQAIHLEVSGLEKKDTIVLIDRKNHYHQQKPFRGKVEFSDLSPDFYTLCRNYRESVTIDLRTK